MCCLSLTPFLNCLFYLAFSFLGGRENAEGKARGLILGVLRKGPEKAMSTGRMVFYWWGPSDVYGYVLAYDTWVARM